MYLAGSMRRAAEAAAEALFPKNDLGAPDFESTELVKRLDGFIDVLPPPQRRLMKLLFIFLEYFAPILRGRMSRFSRMSIDARTELVRSYRDSEIYPIRLLGDAVKGVMTMMYMSHPSVVRFIGDHRAPGEHPLVQLKKGALA